MYEKIRVFFLQYRTFDRVELVTINGVEVLNPKVADDREVLVSAIAEAANWAALPSFHLYDPTCSGRPFVGGGLTRKSKRQLARGGLYGGE